MRPSNRTALHFPAGNSAIISYTSSSGFIPLARTELSSFTVNVAKPFERTTLGLTGVHCGILFSHAVWAASTCGSAPLVCASNSAILLSYLSSCACCSGVGSFTTGGESFLLPSIAFSVILLKYAYSW